MLYGKKEDDDDDARSGSPRRSLSGSSDGASRRNLEGLGRELCALCAQLGAVVGAAITHVATLPCRYLRGGGAPPRASGTTKRKASGRVTSRQRRGYEKVSAVDDDED